MPRHWCECLGICAFIKRDEIRASVFIGSRTRFSEKRPFSLLTRNLVRDQIIGVRAFTLRNFNEMKEYFKVRAFDSDLIIREILVRSGRKLNQITGTFWEISNQMGEE